MSPPESAQKGQVLDPSWTLDPNELSTPNPCSGHGLVGQYTPAP